MGAVSADALPDDELALPQHGPDQVPGATADLHHLPGQRHVLPERALRVVVIDPVSEPHLGGARGRDRRSGAMSRTRSAQSR